MSWKIMPRKTPLSPAKRYRLSIAWSLTAFYTLFSFGLLLFATIFLYWVLAQNIERDEDLFLADKIHILRSILEERPNDNEALVEEVKREGAARQYNKYYVRIMDDKSETLMETPGIQNALGVPAVFPAAIAAEDEPNKGTTWRAPHRKSYRLISAWSKHKNGQMNLIQVAMDLTNEEALLADYQKKLAMVLLIGILLSLAAGKMIARQGLKPLKEITRMTEKITASQLHERIGSSQWPKELSILASEFDGMLDRLEESFSRLSQFSADLAHELRTPIHNLMGEAEIALAKSRTAEEYQDVLGSGLEEYGKLSRMIDSLLFLARAENSERTIEKSNLNLDAEIVSVLEFYEALATEQEVVLENVSSGLPLQADSLLFRRALSNLISNALRYTPGGGKILISSSRKEKILEICVQDNGKGIEKEHLSKIFNRFYRPDYSRTEAAHGTGLGLAIVKSIMSLHGGTVEIQSQTSFGTTVLLRFPDNITKL
jgi:two-component system heavy metal sensor histidine kinase CusS